MNSESKALSAVLFDCDGTLVDTERDGHRVAFNDTFRAFGLAVVWSVEEYGELLRIGGGKERMRHYFDRNGWPEGDRDTLIMELHRAKTARFMEIARSGGLPLRPGVARLIDEALAAEVPVAVCSTSNENSVRAVVTAGLGEERVSRFAGIFAGDIVANKKPAPDIYQFAEEKLGLVPATTIVVEDTRIGLLSAKAAGMKCVATPSPYSREEDFTEADLLADDLDTGEVTLAALEKLL
jgi:HAD superfamily hydrolase (TIGR01509 family)